MKKLGTFAIDLREPPYTVPCPICHAYALAPCRDQQRSWERLPPGVSPPGRVLPRPHKNRWRVWKQFPEIRVKVT